MKRIPSYDKFNYDNFISESYHLVENHMTYAEYDELIGEGFFDFLKGLFTNPLQKRKLDKLAQDLLKTKIELMKLEIEEDSIDSFKDQLKSASNRNHEYATSSSKINVAVKAKATKIRTLQDREEAIVDQMDAIGKDSENQIRVFNMKNDKILSEKVDLINNSLQKISYHISTDQWDHSVEYYEGDGVEEL